MPEASSINLADIQANVVRGYSARQARHFALRVDSPSTGASLLRDLLSGRDSPWPTVTSADAWQQADGLKPQCCLTVGITSSGLAALGVPPAVLSLFPKRFLEGPAAPSEVVKRLGDDGPSDPARWVLGAPNGPAVHEIGRAHV